MKIQVLGSGCPNCHKLYELTQKAVADLKLKAKVEYVTGNKGIQRIIEMGAMSSPVLAVDGKPVITGSIPKIEAIKNILKQKPEKCDCCQGNCQCGGKCC